MSARGLLVRCVVPLAAALFAATLAVPAAKDPTVDEIVERYVAARGGLSKIRSVETLRQTGRASAGPGRDALVTRELKRPGRTRFEFKVQGVTAVFVSDGEQGFRVWPFEGDGEPKPLSGDVLQEAAAQGDIEGPPQRLRIVVDKVEVNPPLSDARFAMPGHM